MTLKREDITSILRLKAPLCLDCRWQAHRAIEPVCQECQLDHIFTTFNEAHNAVIREIRAEVNTITCLDNYKDMSEAVTKLVFSLKQKYGGE